MHPAKSVIFFTVASGAGYGLMVWLGFCGAFGILPAARGFGLFAFGLAFGLIISGLLSSTFHLGHPERAWRALSQWRSSWLSREGVMAIIAFAPMGLFGLFWVVLERNTGLAGLIGLVAAAAALTTVYFTAMIYASLKAIPAWSNRWTPAGYLALSLSTGGLLAAFLAQIWSYDASPGMAITAAFFILLGLCVKLLYWRSMNEAAQASTAESATGLGRFGSVRLVDAPHTQSNYLLDEMGYKIARKHSVKLRRIAITAGFVMPIVLLTIAALQPAVALFFTAGALVAGAIGITVERWLFFAEARHVVMLYYGQSRV